MPMTAQSGERQNASLLLDRNLEAGRADKIAIRAGEDELSYAELARRVNQTGHLLRDLGIRPEDRILLVLDDTPAFPSTFLGAMRIGAVPVPVSPMDRVDNFRYFIDDSYAQAIVAEATHVPAIHEALEGQRDPVTLAANGSVPGALTLEDALADHIDELPPVLMHPDDMAFWLYSSGSTGRPKGVVHLHHDIDYTCETYGRQVLEIQETDVTFSTTKLFHAYGLGNNLSFPYSVGATTVLMQGPTKPEAILDTVERYQPTLFFSVPALYAAILKAPETAERDFSSVRYCISAAEPLPARVNQRWKDAYDLDILDGIGSTEMLHIYCSNRPGKIKPGSSGWPVPGYELKLVGLDDAPVASGEVGDLLVRGDSCAAYYWHQHEKTKSSMRGDWFRSGDRYRCDDDGSYVYEGRADDMIKIGGLWVSPADMEGALVAHDAVSEAAVIGVTIEDASRIKAFVICRQQGQGTDALAEELRAWCKGRLRRYEYPHLVEFVEDFPRTLTGKIQRYKLRDLERSRGA